MGKENQHSVPHHNIDINHLHTLEKQQQRAELKRRMQTSRTQMLLKDNQNKSKTKNIMLHRDASNIMCQPKYMTTLNRKQCSAIFKYKSRMLNVKGNFPGSSNDTLCTYYIYNLYFVRNTISTP